MAIDADAENKALNSHLHKQVDMTEDRRRGVGSIGMAPVCEPIH